MPPQESRACARLKVPKDKYRSADIYLHSDYRGLILPDYPEAVESVRTMHNKSFGPAEEQNVTFGLPDESIRTCPHVGCSSVGRTRRKQPFTQEPFPVPPYIDSGAVSNKYIRRTLGPALSSIATGRTFYASTRSRLLSRHKPQHKHDLIQHLTERQVIQRPYPCL